MEIMKKNWERVCSHCLSLNPIYRWTQLCDKRVCYLCGEPWKPVGDIPEGTLAVSIGREIVKPNRNLRIIRLKIIKRKAIRIWNSIWK